MKNVAILGSTGSIGLNTLKVIDEHKKEFKAVALTANSNLKLLKSQALLYKPKFIGLGEEFECSKELKNINSEIYFGIKGISELVKNKEIDIVVIGISGNAAIEPLISAIESNKKIVTANKESLVSASGLVKEALKEHRTSLIPVDSEQSAIFQCLNKENKSSLKKIYLTGTGGPFRNFSKSRLSKVTSKDALNHPRWKMGSKITIDSATLMNKGFEVLEAAVLFDVTLDKIEVLIHPEAIIHSMVEFVDGTVLAQLSCPDMRIPILYAMSYPERFISGSPKLDFNKVKNLNFEKPDTKKFPSLGIAYKAGKSGGLMPAIMCASDEVAVRAFLDGRIAFYDIPKIIERVLSKAKNKSNPTLSEILWADKWARVEAESVLSRKLKL